MSEETKQLIVFQRGTLDAKTKEHLSKNGYIGIEADDPKSVVTILPTAQFTAIAERLGGDEVVRAMLDVMLSQEARAKEFGYAMLKILRGKY